MPRAEMGTLLGLEIPLPPLNEQRRIVTILSERMTAIERARAAAEAQLEAAQALPIVYLRHVFESPEAKKWSQPELGDICHISTGTTPATNKPEYYQGDVSFIKTTQNIHL